MSMHDVQAIIIRAVMDNDYRELFFNDRSRALEGYNLASIEALWLQQLAQKEFDAFAPEIRSSLKQGGGITPSPQRI